ncbi:MAG TPA: ElyC/SanA/YdcF family protein [Candidatus Eisenbacteria bacterium]|nr:ElyC/SanA/YdcF family protein [Candidatus Eisenbacteria bacterium]
MRADAIVVLAGRPERKAYGLELWKGGTAPALVLSVARFEWRAFPALGLPDDGGLAALVAQTPPRLRHFLVTLNERGAHAEWTPRGRLGTWSEALGTARLARSLGWRSLLLVTTEAHAARARLAFGRALDGSGVAVTLASVPDERSSIRRSGWWKDRWARRVVIGEWIKLPAYWLFARGGPPAPRS